MDGSDGSANWLRVDTLIPLGARQPDGTPFLAALAQGLQVTDILYDPESPSLLVTWPSGAGRNYAVDISPGLLGAGDEGSWEEYDDSIPGEVDETTYEIILEDPTPTRFFIRVRDVTE